MPREESEVSVPVDEVGAGKWGSEKGRVLGTELHFPDIKLLTFPDGWLLSTVLSSQEPVLSSSTHSLDKLLLRKLPIFEALLWREGNGRTKQTKSLPSGGFHSKGETDSKTDKEMDTPYQMVKNARG